VVVQQVLQVLVLSVLVLLLNYCLPVISASMTDEHMKCVCFGGTGTSMATELAQVQLQLLQYTTDLCAGTGTSTSTVTGTHASDATW
jgi:hypothetical protein